MNRFSLTISVLFFFINHFAFSQQDSLEFESYLKEYELQLDSSDNKALFYETCFWESVPYKYAGKTQAGVDCSAFSKNIYASVFCDTLIGTASDLHLQSNPITRGCLVEGDMVFFKIGDKEYVNHVGIYLKDDKFVHASTRKGITVSSLNNPYYKKYFFVGGRFCESNKKGSKFAPFF